MIDRNNIEQSIVPIKMANLIGYIAQKKRLTFTDAMCYFYDSSISEKLYDENAKWWYLDNETLYEEIERDRKKQPTAISDKEQQFIVFCIESYARRNSMTSLQAYALFRRNSLISFLRNNFEILHTQGEDYILEEIKLYLKRRKKA